MSLILGIYIIWIGHPWLGVMVILLTTTVGRNSMAGVKDCEDVG